MRLSTLMLLGFFLLPSWSSYSLAAPMQQPNAAQIQHRIDKLNVLGRVLYVAAHPDDENTRLLTYLVGERKLTTAYLSLTRGDGGQNLIGREQASLLGMIRTQELLQARRLDGAIQFFTRAKDFGYSKSSKETLTFWGHQKVLADTVWVIRSFRPHVIITRFPEKGKTHGHHLASAQLARQAMQAAADPKKFPQQLKSVKTWKATRLIYNVSTWRLRRRGLLKNKKYLSQFLQLDVGGYNPLLGASYGEIAARSRSMHKSQGFGARSQRGPIREFFAHVAGKKAKKDIMEGVKMTWAEVPGAGVLARHLEHARRDFRPSAPTTALPALSNAWMALSRLKLTPQILQKRRELEQVMMDCTGLYLDARAKAPAATPGKAVAVTISALNRSKADIFLDFVQTRGMREPQKVNKKLTKHTPWKSKLQIKIPANAKVSAPSWLAQKGSFGSYAIPNNKVVQRPYDPAPLQVGFNIRIGNVGFLVQRPVQYIWTDRVRGEQARRVEVMPPLTATPQNPMVMFPNYRPQRLFLDVRAATPKVQGKLTLKLPKGWTAKPASIALKFQKYGETQRHSFLLTPPQKGAKGGVAVPVIAVGKRSYSWKEHVLNYPHIPVQTILEPARIKIVPLKLKSFSKRVGYIPGSGDFVVEALRQVGVDVRILDNDAVAGGNFKGYHTIITGIRAYNKNNAVRRYHKRLMAWVKQGGTLLVQYNTNSWWRPLRIPVGPYSMTIGRDRVTDETAPVKALNTKHVLLNQPHKITAADYKGWVQERGLYFAKKWSNEYKPVLQMADPGKKPSQGSLLVAHYGKGAFLYTGISFFRQLPAGVPGAYRLFMNLIAYEKPTK